MIIKQYKLIKIIQTKMNVAENTENFTIYYKRHHILYQDYKLNMLNIAL